jgi:hypothetical protein
MDFLQGNWLWLLLGLGAVWFFFRRGGMGCGMSGHGSHGSHGSRESEDAQRSGDSHAGHNGHGSSEPRERRAETVAPRRRRGC